MGYIDDDEDDYNDVRTHHSNREDQESLKGSPGGDTSLGVAALCLPVWGLGLVVFAWRWVVGSMPFEADTPTPTFFQNLVGGLYFFGAFGAVILAVLAGFLLLHFLFVGAVRWLWSRK